MTSSKFTKRALLSSALAILMCVTMLIGTTFAWFTDTASTGVNKIVSGNLKVDIIGANSDSHIEKLDFTKATGAEGENLLWEPPLSDRGLQNCQQRQSGAEMEG